MGAFCRWYEKDMENLTEHEQEQCNENGQNCCECPDLIIKEKKLGGVEHDRTRFKDTRPQSRE